ncbi:hypothetical protein [Pontibacillus yanchengensis]|uniref:hypothetical protein n=1 Tax=Pontibacillus yanchengensis TaxID=462910 RepID=UPI0013683739|nr:hypothetical protein [Pontibacillus yanchengensis]
MTDLGILNEDNTGAIRVNPSVFYRGAEKDFKKVAGAMQYTRVYRKTIRELYAMYNGRTIKQLGLIYAVLPYINFNYNIVCHNAEEYNKDNVKPMTTADLAKKLGYSKAEQLTKALRGVKYEGQRVFGFFECEDDARKKKIVVNPNVIYAGSGEKLDGIKILFKSA